MPIALDGGELSVAIVDPLNRFVPAAISVATGRSVRLEIAVPIELEAALDRLYPEGGASDSFAISTSATPPASRSARTPERLKDLASEAPVIRLVNQIVSAGASEAAGVPTSTSSRSTTGCECVIAATAC